MIKRVLKGVHFKVKKTYNNEIMCLIHHHISINTNKEIFMTSYVSDEDGS